MSSTSANLDFHRKNNETLHLSEPGRIIGGYTFVPLRFISEALGNTVDWIAEKRMIVILSPAEQDIGDAALDDIVEDLIDRKVSFDTTIKWEVNFRGAPNTKPATEIYRMIPKGENVYVVEETDALCLKVIDKAHNKGYISAKPKYTDYSSKSIAEKQADRLISYGEQFLGTPYEFGASPNQTDTFDCSSFVKHLFQQIVNVDLPRVSYNQAKEGTVVSKDDLQKGDVMFFSARGLSIGHVGIYAGDNKILQTYSKRDGVRYSRFEGQWVDRFVTARRIL